MVEVEYMIVSKSTIATNKNCHKDRIARLTAPCPPHKKRLRKYSNILLTPTPPPTPTPLGSTIALPGHRPGELETHFLKVFSNQKPKGSNLTLP